MMSGPCTGQVYIARSPNAPEPAMTTTADIDPGHDAPDHSLDALAAASLGALSKANPSIAADLEETGQAHTHLRQVRQRDLDAVQVQGKAEQRAAALSAKLD